MPDWPELEAILSLPVWEAAPLLLGAEIAHAGVTVRLTEVEAYGGADDPGSHAFRGPTPRNQVMFGPPGRLYVYFTYGMHHCANVVCGGEGQASAILLRAGEVVGGREMARSRRPRSVDRDLARGPARLCSTLGIDRAVDGADLRTGVVRLRPADRLPAGVSSGPRVGLRAAADRPWRFWETEAATVSAYRAAAPLRAARGERDAGASSS